MKVILAENVSNLGTMGTTVNVADGYARNFLLPRKLAVRADSGSAKQIEHELRIIRRREDKLRAELTEVAKKLEGITVDIVAKAGAEEKLFGSVTNAHIAEHLTAKGFAVDKKLIHLDEPIKTLGIFPVIVKLGHGVEASVKVWVTAEQAQSEEVTA